MIIMGLLSLVKILLNVLFGWVSLPDLPPYVDFLIDEVFDYMSAGIAILSVFIDFELVRVLLPLVIIVHNFDHLYKLGMWILRKIPMVGIK